MKIRLKVLFVDETIKITFNIKRLNLYLYWRDGLLGDRVCSGNFIKGTKKPVIQDKQALNEGLIKKFS